MDSCARSFILTRSFCGYYLFAQGKSTVRQLAITLEQPSPVVPNFVKPGSHSFPV